MSALRTVLGDVDSSEMGITLPHEHVLCDSSTWFLRTDRPGRGPARSRRAHPREPLGGCASTPIPIGSFSTSTTSTSRCANSTPSPSWAGRTVVDLSCVGLGGQPEQLAVVSRRTGLNLVLGTGFYVDASLSDDVRAASVDELTEHLIRDLTEGIGGTDIRAGVIGEIGMSHPLAPVEERSLRAAARASQATGAAISVHTAAHAVEVDSALRAADILGEEGADLSRVIMGHMDTTLHRPDYHRQVVDLGCYAEFDLFGHEFFESENDFISPGDYAKTKAVGRLIAEGYASQILLSPRLLLQDPTPHLGGLRIRASPPEHPAAVRAGGSSGVGRSGDHDGQPGAGVAAAAIGQRRRARRSRSRAEDPSRSRPHAPRRARCRPSPASVRARRGRTQPARLSDASNRCTASVKSAGSPGAPDSYASPVTGDGSASASSSPASPESSNAALARYGLTSAPGRRNSKRRSCPSPTTRTKQVRLSKPHVILTGDHDPGRRRR